MGGGIGVNSLKIMIALQENLKGRPEKGGGRLK